MYKYTNNHINKEDLPSKEQLIRSTKRAFLIALAILILIILPAEYGIDPTYFGRLLGLTEMGKIKVSLQKDIDAQKEKILASKQDTLESKNTVDKVQENLLLDSESILEDVSRNNENSNTEVSIESNSGTTSTTNTFDNQKEKTDTMVVVIEPDQGLEIKAVMIGGQSIKYERNVDVGHLNFDSHGESEDGQVAYYGEGRKEPSGNGQITAGFDGNHGWFFRNRAGETVTLTLKVVGTYQELKQL